MITALPAPRSLALVVFASSMIATVDVAAADDFVVGGYQGLSQNSASTVLAVPDVRNFRASQPDRQAGLVLDFTPRQSGSLLNNLMNQIPAKRLVVGAAENSVPLGAHKLTGIGVIDPDRVPGQFSIGGALEFESFRVLGGYTRVDLMGQPADVVSAGVDYGRVSATFAFGQSESEDVESQDTFMLSTDLAALSWLTLESDVLFGNDQQDESMAAGRLGLRLDF